MNTAELFGQTFSLSLMDCTAHLPRSSENGLSALQLPLLMLLLAGVSGAVRAISSVRISLSSPMTCSAQEAGKREMHPACPLTGEHSLGAFPTCHVDPLLGGDLHEYCGAVWSNVLTVPDGLHCAFASKQ